MCVELADVQIQVLLSFEPGAAALTPGDQIMPHLPLLPHTAHLLHVEDEILLAGSVQLDATVQAFGVGDACQIRGMDHQALRDSFLAQIFVIETKVEEVVEVPDDLFSSEIP